MADEQLIVTFITEKTRAQLTGVTDTTPPSLCMPAFLPGGMVNHQYIIGSPRLYRIIDQLINPTKIRIYVRRMDSKSVGKFM